MDILLARQYNLISCLLEQGSRNGRGNGGGGGRAAARGAAMQDTPDSALARIESMRRSIGVAGATTTTDQLQLLEVLGEGAFGKVYKGLWRGTTVAIKTMVLPAKMSGAEKHERMAIMEAAISSTMNHPNIVQTYTYTIKPTSSTHAAGASQSGKSKCDSSAPSDDPFSTDSHTLNFERDRISLPPRARLAPSRPAPGAPAAGAADKAAPAARELQMLGSLRDALDRQAFKSGAPAATRDRRRLRGSLIGDPAVAPEASADGTLNYAAVLDTAADIARAMLHLHKQQVLHSDLKARNVLLKTDGTSDRGVIAK
ncbi:hypothetical protein MNEG_12331, partial [Monoraphidium neglectum]